MFNILITSAGGNGAGNQIAKSLRLCKDEKYNLFFADNNTNNIQFRDDSIINLPLVSDDKYFQKISEVIVKNEIHVIVPGSDKELIYFAKNIDLFHEKGVYLPINNFKTINLCLDKVALNEKLVELNYHPPKSIRISFDKDLPEIDWYPVVLKPTGSSGGSENVFIAQNKNEITNLMNYLNGAYKDELFILQEYIGKSDSEYTVGILHDSEGQFVDSIAMKRDLSQSISIRSSIKNYSDKPELGEKLIVSSGVSQGIIGKFPNITSQCRDIAESICSSGPLNIQCRVVENTVKIFEINPRFSGTSFFRSLVGFNEVDLLIRRHLLNQNIQRNKSWDDYHAIRNLEETIFKS